MLTPSGASFSGKIAYPNQSLRTLFYRDLEPYRDQVAELTANSVHSPRSREAYRHCVQDFFAFWKGTDLPLSQALVDAYKVALQERGASANTINLRLSAIRAMARVLEANGLIPTELAIALQRTKGAPKRNVKRGIWLSNAQARALLDAPDPNTLLGLRDRAILGILLGTGLRRTELTALEVKHLRTLEGRLCIVDLKGKGGRYRTIPLPAWVAARLTQWLNASGITEGKIFRNFRKGNRIAGQGLTGVSVDRIVKRYGQALGLQVSPHDLRRTFAKRLRRNGGSLEQIQLVMGHASIATTERYLGVDLDLENAVTDLAIY